MHLVFRNAAALGVATAVWLPALHHFHRVDDAARERIAVSLEKRAVVDATNDVELMRDVNPEWDWMSRTFTVLGLANRALAREDERPSALAAMDRIIERASEDAREQERFLLPYAHAKPFVDPAARSVFIDGELLAMIAARELVRPQPDFGSEANELALSIEGAMRRSPTLSAESYPDECWTFCNTTALAALAMLDRVHGDHAHAALAKDWVLRAKSRLVDERTGMLVSSFTRDGRVLDGPEGSSIWMSAANLLFVDDAFARDQYGRARRELGATTLGFGWAREWPAGAAGHVDVDSGAIIPLLGASAGSSGLAVLGASAFGDDAFRDALLSSLELAAMPRDGASGRRYLASNRVGDAVLFDALAFGPLLAKVKS
jgi:hypothetical protein